MPEQAVTKDEGANENPTRHGDVDWIHRLFTRRSSMSKSVSDSLPRFHVFSFCLYMKYILFPLNGSLTDTINYKFTSNDQE